MALREELNHETAMSTPLPTMKTLAVWRTVHSVRHGATAAAAF